MRTWAGLFQRVDEIDPLQRRLHAERAAFETWAAAAEARVMVDLARVAKEKSRETRSRTGISVTVTFEANRRTLASFGGSRGLVSLSFSGSSVDIYATRPEGQSANVHLACQRAATTSRYPVVVTLPGCFVVRTNDAPGYRLLSLPDRQPTDVDALVLRAFEILFGAFESVIATRALGVEGTH